MRLLLIEDDELLGDALKTGLIQFDFVVDWIKDGQSALLAVSNESFDLIILDLGLPKIPGMNFLKKIREKGISTPILILTARDAIDDRVTGLDSGADDYMTKPCDLNELSARIRALIRRSQGRADAILVYKNITLDPAAHAVTIDNKLIGVPKKEFALLHKLLENIGQVLSKEVLVQSIYSWDDELDSNALEVHIHNLRKKLNPDFIKTIRGVGYLVEKEK
ncbi:MAG: DNA-binding response regulator [Legionellales bacterium RIFCSPHIGHO2_12_FULL_35_11]|nr:MAG: DNA-binding response regulator [Legionellales bacterium RIFCSPHIGHO2_12_FULL_35_11]